MANPAASMRAVRRSLIGRSFLSNITQIHGHITARASRANLADRFRMTGAVAKYSLLVATLCAAATAVASGRRDPFAFLAPDVVVAPAEREQLDADQTVVRVLPGRDGFLSVSAIVRVGVDGDRFLAWARAVEVLQKGKYVPEIGRFSLPPRLDDLHTLTMEADDLDALARCRPGDCGVKLSAVEIAQLRATTTRAQLEQSFRQILVDRAAAYLSRGDSCALPYHDHKAPVAPQQAFASVLDRLQFLPRNLPCVADYLRAFPQPHDGHVTESFLYWSKETLGMKPTISITHFTAARFGPRSAPDVAVVAKQIYATHYKDAAMTVTALTRDGPHAYLVYVHRSRVDAFHGIFGGMVRRIVERRVKAEAPSVLLGLRTRLESGDAPY
jgi:hypothetical protein